MNQNPEPKRTLGQITAVLITAALIGVTWIASQIIGAVAFGGFPG